MEIKEAIEVLNKSLNEGGISDEDCAWEVVKNTMREYIKDLFIYSAKNYVGAERIKELSDILKLLEEELIIKCFHCKDDPKWKTNCINPKCKNYAT